MIETTATTPPDSVPRSLHDIWWQGYAAGSNHVNELLVLLRIVRGKHAMGIFTLPVADVERINAALIAGENQ